MSGIYFLGVNKLERGFGLISFAKHGFERIFILGDLAALREEKTKCLRVEFLAVPKFRERRRKVVRRKIGTRM